MSTMQLVCAVVVLASAAFIAPAAAFPRGDIISAQTGGCAGLMINGGCCSGGGCYVSSEGCFCDQVCHVHGDCCSDIESIDCEAPTASQPPPLVTCSASGLSTGCCPGTGFECFVPGGSCFCDSSCTMFGDCCSDVVDTSLCSATSPTTPPIVTCSVSGLSIGCCPGTASECFVPGGNCFCDSSCTMFGDCCSDVVDTSLCSATSTSNRQKQMRARAQNTARGMGGAQRTKAQSTVQGDTTGRNAEAEFNSKFFKNIGNNVLKKIGSELAAGFIPQGTAQARGMGRAQRMKAQSTVQADRIAEAASLFNSQFFQDIGSDILQTFGSQLANEIAGLIPQGSNRAAASANENSIAQLKAALALAKRVQKSEATSQGFSLQDFGQSLNDIGADLLQSIADNLANLKKPQAAS